MIHRLLSIWAFAAVLAVTSGSNADQTKPAVEDSKEKKSEPVTANVGPPKVTKLSLDECIRKALANSRQLAAERHRLAALEAKVDQLWWAPFSGFKLEGMVTWVPDKCIDKEVLNNEGRIVGCDGGNVTGDEDYKTQEWGPSFHLSFQGGVPIYTFGKISNAKEAAKQAYLAKQAQFPSFQQQIRYDVQRAFHAIVGSREMLYTIGEGRKHIKKARKKLETDLENQEGTETEVDLIKLKVFEAQIDYMVRQTEKIEETAIAALQFLIGGAQGTPIDIPDDPQILSDRELLPLSEYVEDALRHRPELAALRHTIKAMEAKVQMHKSDFFPDFVFVLGWRFGWTEGRTDISNWALKDNYNYGTWVPYAGVAMKYNFDVGVDKYRLDEAKAELAALSADQQRALDAIIIEVESTYIEILSARESIEVLEKSRRLVKGWIAAAVQNHGAGLGGSKDVKDALKEYFSIMASIHKLTGEFNAGLAKLDKATGFERPENE